MLFNVLYKKYDYIVHDVLKEELLAYVFDNNSLILIRSFFNDGK